MNNYLGFSQESSLSFINDYLKFAINNRVVAIDAYLKDIDNLGDVDSRILGAKIYSEYGAAIEEEFAIAYAIVEHNREIEKLENKTNNNQSNSADKMHKPRFFKEVFINYNNWTLGDFIRNTNFNDGVEKIFGFIEPKEYACLKHLKEQDVINDYKTISSNLELLQNEYIEGKLHRVYLKLKHGFLVKYDCQGFIDKTKKAVGVYTKSDDTELLADAIPISVEKDVLVMIRQNADDSQETIRRLLEFFIDSHLLERNKPCK
ncbi:MAG: hypothetical protein GY865_02695 [candidate division Zixibacteria bacterium]|nr:hypothetical protein [candidate division Zixibacteria bacterium]